MVRASALATALLLLVPASSQAATPDVQLVNESASVAGCERLGEIKGGSLWGGMMTNMAYNRALAGLKEKAAKAGATHVLLLNVSSGMAGSNALGVAYRCAAPSIEKSAP